jgi:hypothetical protein
MYNRYVEDAAFSPVEPESRPPEAQTPAQEPPKKGVLNQLLSGLSGGSGGKSGLSGILSGLKPDSLDRGDILLILILLYLFWESEDEELLIILGLMLLTGFS